MIYAKPVQNGETAAQILLDLMQTPQLSRLKFEFEVGIEGLPFVKYTVERFAVDGDQEECDT